MEHLGTLLEELGARDVYVLPTTSGAQLIAARERAFFVGKAAGCDDLIDAVLPRAVHPRLPGPGRRAGAGARRTRHRLRPHRRRQRARDRLPARRRASVTPSCTPASSWPSQPAAPSRASTASAPRSCRTSWRCEDPVSLELDAVHQAHLRPRRDPRAGPAARAGADGSVIVNGARSLLSTLVDAGVDVCFANPGTSEMHFVAALDDVPAMRGVLCLFEGVVTGAADGYGRVAGRPAATLLHLGPGPRQRAGQPAQRTAGAHAGREHRRRPRHVPRPLRRAAPVRHRLHRRRGLGVVPLLRPGRRRGRQTPPMPWRPRWARPGCVATLVLPADSSWSESTHRAAARRGRGVVPSVVPADTVRGGGQGPALGRAVGAARWVAPRSGRDGLHAASRVAVATGAALLGETFPANLERGRGHPGGGAAGLPGRDGPGPTRRRPPPRPGRRQGAGVLLRLSRQGERPGPGRLHRAHAGPPGRGRRGSPRGPGRGAGRPSGRGCPGPVGPTRAPDGRRLDGVSGRRRGCDPARGCHRGRRGQHVGPLRLRGDSRRAPPRLAHADGRGHRHRAPHGDRSGRGGPRAPGALPAGRRQRHVHAAGPVDPGPGGART